MFVCQDLEELLNKVSNAESALCVERNGMAILELIQRARERRSKNISEEMKVVIDQRDAALSRVRFITTLHQKLWSN